MTSDSVDVSLIDILGEVQSVITRAAGYTIEDVYRLYADYVQHCFPSQFMSFKVRRCKQTVLTLACDRRPSVHGVEPLT